MSYNRGANDIQSRVSCFYGENNLRCPQTERLMKKQREFLWAPGNGFNFLTFLFRVKEQEVSVLSVKQNALWG